LTANFLSELSLAIATLALVVSLSATLISQARSDRRSRREERWRQMSARRERLRPRFEGILKTAYRFKALASPMSEMWKSKLTEEDLKRLQPIIQEIDRETEDAQVALNLEDQSEPLAALKTIRDNFITFRSSTRSSDAEGERAEKAFDTAVAMATEIDNALPSLEEALLNTLESLVPPKTPLTPSGRPRVLDWLGFGD
jgi:hypothetical protein